MGYVGVNFKMEYQAEDGNIRDFFPDFFVKRDDKDIFIVGTKGREDLDDIRKIKRLCLWCNDVNKNQDAYRYTPLYVKQEEWGKRARDLRTFEDLAMVFRVTG